DPTEDSEKENDLLPLIPTTSSDNGLPSGGARPKEKKRGILKNYENGKVVERVRRGRKTPEDPTEDVEEQSRHDIAIGLSTDKCLSFPTVFVTDVEVDERQVVDLLLGLDLKLPHERSTAV
ncbi:hypothetical protein J6590_092692, partial [Homalodisca vitripennis]